MNEIDTIDSHFLSMVSLICDRHNAKFDVDLETRTVNFLSGNVTDQLIYDIEALFGSYGV